ncbi:MAG: hypothetical protein CMM60_03285 [Rhodospirillaceae bacterium]|jgi:hypothetical protein|nr:hypothetical protein [Rhodospirillaceae bacterium]|tara:strand:+ start:7959 stop:8645 length:687 start_codon:yes stop_codon:yes gene_type:complete
MKKYFFLFLIFLTGCMAVAPDHNLVLPDTIDIESAKKEINQYNNSSLQKANIFNSITFGFRGKKMSALGITALDSINHSFSVAGISPMGLTLFKIKVKNNKIVSSYVIPKFGGDDLTKAADMISKDIGNIYFNRTPDIDNNLINIDKDGVTIKTKIDNKDFKYTFSGTPLKLITKSMYKNNKKLWSVDYYDYKQVNEKEIAFNILLINYEYGYTLDTKTKEVRHEPGQ